MDKLGEAIAAVVIGIVILYLVCIVVAYLILAAAVAAPPALSGYWLKDRVRSFALSRRKVWECVLLGLALFSLPFLVLLADASVWPFVLWGALLLGLAGPATYLTVEGYRQVFWPHRKAILAHWADVWRLRREASQRGRDLARLEKAMRHEEQEHGELRQERARISSLAHDIVVRSDPAFYSAEMARWQHQCVRLPMERLQRAASDSDVLVEYLGNVLARLPAIMRDNPDALRSGLQAAAIQMEQIDRIIGSTNQDHEHRVENIKRLKAEIDLLRSRSQAAETNCGRARETIHRLRRERPAIH